MHQNSSSSILPWKIRVMERVERPEEMEYVQLLLRGRYVPKPSIKAQLERLYSARTAVPVVSPTPC